MSIGADPGRVGYSLNRLREFAPGAGFTVSYVPGEDPEDPTEGEYYTVVVNMVGLTPFRGSTMMGAVNLAVTELKNRAVKAKR